MRSTPHRLFEIAALWALTSLAPSVSRAAPVTVFGGYDHYTGAFQQRTDDVVAGVSLTAGGGDATVAGMRYDDSRIGRGYGLTGGAGATLTPAATLRVQATQFVGDGSFRGWRLKAGPQLALPGGGSATISYAHYHDNAPTSSDGAIAELAAPVASGLTAKVTGSCATVPQSSLALQGAVGLGWRAVSHLEISGELGMARNASGATGPFVPAPQVLPGPPLLGGPPATDEFAATALLGVRVFLP